MTPGNPEQREDFSVHSGAQPETPSDSARDEEPDDETGAEPLVELPRPVLSFRTAMLIYALLAAFAFATLHGDWLFVALLVIFAIALKTWIAQVRDRLE